jgi:LAS superfamily LD-carboxypeptidase LdcB
LPQQHPTRASLRRTTRARRSPRVHAVTTGAAIVTAAALAGTTAVPSGLATAEPAVRATSSLEPKAVTVLGSAVVGAETAAVHTDPRTTAAVGAAVTQASGALAKAELVTTEGADAPADAIEQIEQTTSVVRELVRRVSAPDAASTPATTEPATADPTEDAAGDAAGDDAGETAETTEKATGVDPTITAAADAAVTAVMGDDATAQDADPEAVATALEQQTAALAQLIDENPAAAVTVIPGPTPEEIAAQKAAEEAAAAAAAREAEVARLAALAAEAQKHANGQLPDHVLAAIPWAPGDRLRADATDALIRLNEQFKAVFGTDLGITSSYRSFGDQVAVKRARGFWAAVPGSSNHGYGVAVDLGTGVADFGSPQFAWMKENAPAFGWTHPDWAGQGGSKPEPWHWEYTG